MMRTLELNVMSSHAHYSIDTVYKRFKAENTLHNIEIIPLFVFVCIFDMHASDVTLTSDFHFSFVG